jgi:hypothetical protein
METQREETKERRKEKHEWMDTETDRQTEIDR